MFPRRYDTPDLLFASLSIVTAQYYNKHFWAFGILNVLHEHCSVGGGFPYVESFGIPGNVRCPWWLDTLDVVFCIYIGIRYWTYLYHNNYVTTTSSSIHVLRRFSAGQRWEPWYGVVTFERRVDTFQPPRRLVTFVAFLRHWTKFLLHRNTSVLSPIGYFDIVYIQNFFYLKNM